MPIDLNNPKYEPTIGLYTKREPVEERELSQREKLEDGLRSNAMDEGGVRRIKLNGRRLPERRKL